MARAIIFLLEALLMTSAAGEIFDPSESFSAARREFKGTHICENHVARLHCGRSSATMRVYTAKYGRDNNNICNSEDTHKAMCTPVDKTVLLRKYCDHKSNCVVSVNSTTLGVVCPHVDKFLNVIYICVHQDPLSTFVQSTSRAPETTIASPSAETQQENSAEDSTQEDFHDTLWVQVGPRPVDNHGNKIAHLGGFVFYVTQVTAVVLIASM